MTSNETELVNSILPWGLGFASIIASIWAGMRVLICKGKTQANNENRIKLIENEVKLVLGDFETFKKWAYKEHEEMNASVERRFLEFSKVTSELKAAIAETNGYLKRLAEEKTS